MIPPPPTSPSTGADRCLASKCATSARILDLQKITRLPNTPMDVLGVVDVRGASVPIVDLKSRLGFPPVELGEEARIVMLEIDAGAGQKPLGILADRVRNDDQIAPDEIEPSPSVGVDSRDTRVLRGCGVEVPTWSSSSTSTGSSADRRRLSISAPAPGCSEAICPPVAAWLPAGTTSPLAWPTGCEAMFQRPIQIPRQTMSDIINATAA